MLLLVGGIYAVIFAERLYVDTGPVRLNSLRWNYYHKFLHMSTGWADEYSKYIQGAVTRQLNADSPQAEQPPWIKTALRPHQLTLLAAAQALEKRANLSEISLTDPQLLTSFGCLCDRVGAGKSLVALSLIREPPVAQAHFTCREGGAARILGVRHMQPVQEWKPEWDELSEDAVGAEIKQAGNGRWYSKTALIIVPHNVMTQWEEYVTKQTDLRALLIRKTKECDYDRKGFLRDIFTSDVVIVSCTMLRKFIGALSYHGPHFQHVSWSRLFIDEADSLTCSLRQGDVSARFTWFITGSWLNMMFPHGLQTYTVSALSAETRALIGDGYIAGISSHLNVVANTVAATRDPRFTATILRNSNEWIETSLLRPAIVHETVMCRAPPNVEMLRGFVSAAALEALHAGDTAGAMAAMGIKAMSKASIGEAVTASLRGELVQAEKLLAFKRDIEYSTPAAKKEAIVKAEAKVARLTEQLGALEARVAGVAAAAEHCPICYDTPRTTTLTPCCRQAFCLSCICECVASKPACPLCRQAIPGPKSLIVLGSDEEAPATTVEENPLPTKGAALLNLLSESTADQRYLVFSAHEASFKGLRDMLASRDIRCEVLQGTAARIDRLRKQFRDGTVRVLCMNARHVGAGINLEAATHVVLYHRMNMELERQVIGRAVRFERAAELRVVHMIHEEETTHNGHTASEIIMHC